MFSSGADRSAFFRRLMIYLIGVVIGIFIIIPIISDKKKEVRLKKRMNLPEIIAKDADGNFVSINDYKGSLLLVDFWGSYCAPCRGANVELKYLYKKYHNASFKAARNFEILAISMDKVESDWKSAVEKDSITWPSVIVPESDMDSVIKWWGLRDIPTLILADSNGVILSKTNNMDAIKFAIREELAK